MCYRSFEVAIGCFDGSLSNAHFSRLIITSYHRLQSHPSLSKPLAANRVDLATHIVNQNRFHLLFIKIVVCNTYSFVLVSCIPFHIICPPLISHPSPSKPLATNRVDLATHIVNQNRFHLLFIKIVVCNTYSFVLVSCIPFHIICPPLIHL